MHSPAMDATDEPAEHSGRLDQDFPCRKVKNKSTIGCMLFDKPENFECTPYRVKLDLHV